MEIKKKHKVLITGAGGFLGTAIVKRLSQMPEKEDYELLHLSRKNYPHLLQYPIKQLQGDLTQPASSWCESLKGVETIIHTASVTDMWGPWEKFYQTNFLGTKALLLAAKKNSVKNFIYTSTPSVVFGNESMSGVDESTPYPHRYYSYYARSKAMAEKEVLAHHDPEHFRTVSLRPHLLWGAFDPHFLPRLKERALKKRLFQVGPGKNQVDVIYVDNAAYAHELVLKKMGPHTPVGGKAYFLGQERPVFFWDFLAQLLQAAKLPALPPRKMPTPLAYTLGGLMELLFKALKINNHWPPLTRFMVMQMTKDHYYSHQAAARDFGYHLLYSIEEGLVKMEQDLTQNKLP